MGLIEFNRLDAQSLRDKWIDALEGTNGWRMDCSSNFFGIPTISEEMSRYLPKNLQDNSWFKFQPDIGSNLVYAVSSGKSSILAIATLAYLEEHKELTKLIGTSIYPKGVNIYGQTEFLRPFGRKLILNEKTKEMEIVWVQNNALALEQYESFIENKLPPSIPLKNG